MGLQDLLKFFVISLIFFNNFSTVMLCVDLKQANVSSQKKTMKEGGIEKRRRIISSEQITSQTIYRVSVAICNQRCLEANYEIVYFLLAVSLVDYLQFALFPSPFPYACLYAIHSLFPSNTDSKPLSWPPFLCVVIACDYQRAIGEAGRYLRFVNCRCIFFLYHPLASFESFNNS